MYAHLPETIKAEILHYLTTNNFTAAKKIYDACLAQQKILTSHHREAINMLCEEA